MTIGPSSRPRVFAPEETGSRVGVGPILGIVSDQQATAEIQLIEVGGLTVGYRQVGSGPTLVLLHGAFEDGRVRTGSWQTCRTNSP